MPKHPDSGPPSAASFMRVQESSLLSREQLERLAAAETDGELRRLLAEYGRASLDLHDLSQTEREIRKREAAILAQLTAHTSASKALDLFRIKYDYHNAKVLLKSEAAGIEAGHLLSEGGRLEPERLARECQQSESSLFPLLFEAIREARESLKKDAQAADILLDRAMYREYLALSKGWTSKVVKRCVQLRIDAANLKTMARVRRRDLGLERLQEALIDGGRISPQRIAEIVSANGSLESLYASTPLEAAAARLQAAIEGGSLSALERQIDRAVLGYFKSGQAASFGPAPIIACMAAAEAEGEALRVILSCRKAGFPPATIHERLGDYYAS